MLAFRILVSELLHWSGTLEASNELKNRHGKDTVGHYRISGTGYVVCKLLAAGYRANDRSAIVSIHVYVVKLSERRTNSLWCILADKDVVYIASLHLHPPVLAMLLVIQTASGIFTYPSS